MGFHNQTPEKAPGEVCVLCARPSTGHVWGTPICEPHWGTLAAEMPTAGDIAAAATPEEIERVVQCQYMPSEVILKDGVLEKRYREWLVAWVKRQRPLRLVTPP